MTAPDDDWSDLSRAWTDRTTAPLPFNPGLVRAVRHRDNLARFNFAAEVSGGVISFGVVLWAALTRGLPWPVAAAALAFAGFATAMTLWSRHGETRVMIETPQAVLRSAIAQARLGIRWAWAGMAISAAGSAFLVVIAMQPPPSGAAQSVWPFLTAAAFLIVCIGVYLRHLRRCRRRIASHEAALAAFGEPPSPI